MDLRKGGGCWTGEEDRAGCKEGNGAFKDLGNMMPAG